MGSLLYKVDPKGLSLGKCVLWSSSRSLPLQSFIKLSFAPEPNFCFTCLSDTAQKDPCRGPTGKVGDINVSSPAAAAKSLQSCPTLWDPIDGSPPDSPVPGILQARTLEWVAIFFSNAWKWKVKVKSLSLSVGCHCLLHKFPYYRWKNEIVFKWRLHVHF